MGTCTDLIWLWKRFEWEFEGIKKAKPWGFAFFFMSLILLLE
jgi:hypothetical protein